RVSHPPFRKSRWPRRNRRRRTSRRADRRASRREATAPHERAPVDASSCLAVLLSPPQKAVFRIWVGGSNVTPCGVGIGVGSGLRNGAPPLSISHRSSMALSSCKVLWQCSDRKSTRLNSSHVSISYAVFCLKKKKHIT